MWEEPVLSETLVMSVPDSTAGNSMGNGTVGNSTTGHSTGHIILTAPQNTSLWDVGNEMLVSMWNNPQARNSGRHE